MRGRFQRAFSLAEVVLAVAVVTAGLIVILGLLPSLVRLSGDSTDTHTALRLAGMVEAALQQRATADFGGLGSALPVMSADPEQGLRLVAARDGTDLRFLDPGESPGRDQFFLVVVRGFPGPPLAYDPGAAGFGANVLVAWPYRPLTPIGLAAASVQGGRQYVEFNLGMNR